MAKERYQNPACGDEIKLRLFTYNSNNLADVSSVEKVEIYFLDPEEKTDSNPDGRRLVQTITSGDVTKESTGTYLVEFELTQPLYTIGKYLDVWTISFESEECDATITNPFQVFPDIWYTTPIPVVYDFSYKFRPNRMVKGSNQFLIIEVTPNVPRGSDLSRYYENLAIVADLRISIEQACGDCVPAEKDLRLVVDRCLVDYREKRFGYFRLNTGESGLDLDCGIYNVWFELNLGENTYISDKHQIQIFE